MVGCFSFFSRIGNEWAFDHRMWTVHEPKGILRENEVENEKLKLVSDGCDLRSVSVFGDGCPPRCSVAHVFTLCILPQVWLWICWNSDVALSLWRIIGQSGRIFLVKSQRLIMLYSMLFFCGHFVSIWTLLAWSYTWCWWRCWSKCRTLGKTISNLEMELAGARATQESLFSGSPTSQNFPASGAKGKRKYLMVVGINTAFSSRKRRDSVRETWMPQGWRSCTFFFLFFNWLGGASLNNICILVNTIQERRKKN